MKYRDQRRSEMLIRVTTEVAQIEALDLAERQAGGGGCIRPNDFRLNRGGLRLRWCASRSTPPGPWGT